MSYQPVMKWTGSKRSQAPEIVKFIIKQYETYYEPFCGGCSMLNYILQNKATHFTKFICSDLNDSLIETFKMIKNEPEKIKESYDMLWNCLNREETQSAKGKIFEQIREQYNKQGSFYHDPRLFMFIMRTTTNGMPRYNKQGEFNNSFHITRNGIEPTRFFSIIDEWSTRLNEYDVQFICRSFTDINPSENDFCYFDPPYAGVKKNQMYFGALNQNILFTFLNNLSCDWLLSYDGIAGTDDMRINVCSYVDCKENLIKSGNSSFRRTIGKNTNTIVYESLYSHIK